jgi:hypothetical protein
MPAPTIQINQRALMARLTTSEPVLKKVAEKMVREGFFDPAVEQMKNEFESHPVTREIDGGISAANESDTLQGDFKTKSGKNLYSFIGFDSSDGESPLQPIRDRLDPKHPDGPKIVYKGMDKQKITFDYIIKAPKEAAIHKATPMPWAKGLSWSKRIEYGIPGIANFLNKLFAAGSRSWGGVQVDQKLRDGARFKPTTYLTGIFKNFLATIGNKKYETLRKRGSITTK